MTLAACLGCGDFIPACCRLCGSCHLEWWEAWAPKGWDRGKMHDWSELWELIRDDYRKLFGWSREDSLVAQWEREWELQRPQDLLATGS